MLFQQDNQRAGRIFVEAGMISREQEQIILEKASSSGRFFCSCAADLGFASEEKMLGVLARVCNMPLVQVSGAAAPSPVLLEKVPSRFAAHYRVFPLEQSGQVLTLAVTDPLDVQMIDDLRMLAGCEVKPVLAREKEIADAIRSHYGVGADTMETLSRQSAEGLAQPAGQEVGKAVEDINRADDASIITFVNQILADAIKSRATDIHLEPYQDGLRVRYRIDGILYDTSIPESVAALYPFVVSRIKIMTSLDISERRLPQDGRFKVKVDNRELDLRVSTIPSIFGEAVHLRILSSYLFLDLDKLGFDPRDLKMIEAAIVKPNGIVMVTGPTGSGKSTTLYACLARINLPGTKIITIEDPVEYQLKGITQIQVAPKIGLSFAQCLRHMLRHDPDVMMVGEIRDAETAEISIRAALTGHLVFATLHTNDAAGTVTRLLDMGIEPFLLASSLECLIAQRLVRVICPQCRQEVDVPPETQSLLSREGFKTARRLVKGAGCQACRMTGYQGRTAIHEIIRMTPQIREAVLARASSQQVRRIAVEQGMRTLLQDGIAKAVDGITTIAEVLRVSRQQEE